MACEALPLHPVHLVPCFPRLSLPPHTSHLFAAPDWCQTVDFVEEDDAGLVLLRLLKQEPQLALSLAHPPEGGGQRQGLPTVSVAVQRAILGGYAQGPIVRWPCLALRSWRRRLMYGRSAQSAWTLSPPHPLGPLMIILRLRLPRPPPPSLGEHIRPLAHEEGNLLAEARGVGRKRPGHQRLAWEEVWGRGGGKG